MQFQMIELEEVSAASTSDDALEQGCQSAVIPGVYSIGGYIPCA